MRTQGRFGRPWKVPWKTSDIEFKELYAIREQGEKDNAKEESEEDLPPTDSSEEDVDDSEP